MSPVRSWVWPPLTAFCGYFFACRNLHKFKVCSHFISRRIGSKARMNCEQTLANPLFIVLSADFILNFAIYIYLHPSYQIACNSRHLQKRGNAALQQWDWYPASESALNPNEKEGFKKPIMQRPSEGLPSKRKRALKNAPAALKTCARCPTLLRFFALPLHSQKQNPPHKRIVRTP